MRTWGITATLITAALIAGCSSGTSDGTSGEPTAATSPTSTTEASPAETTAATSPTSTTEASPAETTEAAAEQPDLTDEIRQAAGDNADLITAATETEPGRISIETTIVDPRGDDGSPEALQGIAICEAAKAATDATYVSVIEADGTTFILAGHPAYGPDCTEA